MVILLLATHAAAFIAGALVFRNNATKISDVTTKL